MTINEAHNYIKLEIDKTSSLELPAFESEEIDYWLDDSILRFVKQKYSGNNVKGESFEQSQKRMEDLQNLINRVSMVPSGSSVYDNAEQFDLSSISSYLFSVQETADITYNSVESTVRIIPISHDRLSMKLDDPFSGHNIFYNTAKPLRLYANNYIILIGDGNYSIDTLNISYIKQPEKMADIVNRDLEYTDLNDSSMHEIVKIAANSMLENIESPRYQTHSKETTSLE